MSLLSTLLAISSAVGFIALILFVVFGQVTVRKLRNNPLTKEELGLEFASGWDIINVAQALAMPKLVMRKLKSSSVSFLYADTDLLCKHTNRIDRILAALFYWPFIFAGLSFAFLALFDVLGFFAE